MAEFKVVAPAGLPGRAPIGSGTPYELEMEALGRIDAQIVETSATSDEVRSIRMAMDRLLTMPQLRRQLPMPRLMFSVLSLKTRLGVISIRLGSIRLIMMLMTRCMQHRLQSVTCCDPRVLSKVQVTTR